ncbi:MAG: hypothetical protein LKJ88_07675 [Bacilli bacterium]|jgi:hypothetical protein|nr:hypothetical protein [Bacilli bacterium]
MKKSVVISIICLALLSIIFVAFFGVTPAGIIPTVYIQSVEIKDMSGNKITKLTAEGEKTITVKFQPTLEVESVKYMQYFFTTKIMPEDATLSAIRYYCAENDFVKVENPKNGALLIKQMNLATSSSPYYICNITCAADDGGLAGIEDNLKLVIDYRQA